MEPSLAWKVSVASRRTPSAGCVRIVLVEKAHRQSAPAVPARCLWSPCPGVPHPHCARDERRQQMAIRGVDRKIALVLFHDPTSTSAVSEKRPQRATETVACSPDSPPREQLWIRRDTCHPGGGELDRRRGDRRVPRLNARGITVLLHDADVVGARQDDGRRTVRAQTAARPGRWPRRRRSIGTTCVH